MNTPHHPSFVPSAEESAFVSRALNAVSRSFALVIPMLEAPLDTSVGVAYLLCRVCDNIEDCTLPFAWKQARFAEFKALLQAPHDTQETLSAWDAYAWDGLRPEEKDLMGLGDGAALWRLFDKLPTLHKPIIARWATEMAIGMEKLLTPAPNESTTLTRGIQILRQQNDLDKYCYYVAGTVGHMCTELAILHYNLDESNVDILNYHCEAFGRALQKTNIFKDFAEDMERGVCYFPASWLEQIGEAPFEGKGAPEGWTRHVIAHIWDELSCAVDYVAALPYEATGYRQFCLRAILPAYETMLLAATMTDQLFTPAHAVKITRERMVECLQLAAEMDSDNAKLLAYRAERTQARDDLLHVRPPLGYTTPSPKTRMSA